MGQPVKLSDVLVADARATSDLSQRSIAGQIEFWARLGRAADLLLNGAEAMALNKRGSSVPLSDLIATIDSPAGRKRLAEHLAAQPFPHFEAAPGQPGWLIRIEADGTRTVGHFVGREFRAAPDAEAKPSRGRKKSVRRARSTKR